MKKIHLNLISFLILCFAIIKSSQETAAIGLEGEEGGMENKGTSGCKKRVRFGEFQSLGNAFSKPIPPTSFTPGNKEPFDASVVEEKKSCIKSGKQILPEERKKQEDE